MTHLSEAQLAEQLDKSPSAVRVTKHMIEQRIASTHYLVLPDTTVTICSITLDNGFSARGESACVDPKNFNADIGRTLAHKDAFDKLWAFFGFLICEMKFIALCDEREDAVLRSTGVQDGE